MKIEIEISPETRDIYDAGDYKRFARRIFAQCAITLAMKRVGRASAIFTAPTFAKQIAAYKAEVAA